MVVYSMNTFYNWTTYFQKNDDALINDNAINAFF